jgi:hypothetical protein
MAGLIYFVMVFPVWAAVEYPIGSADFTYNFGFSVWTSRVFDVGVGNTVDFGVAELGTTNRVNNCIVGLLCAQFEQAYVVNVIWLQGGAVVPMVPDGLYDVHNYWTDAQMRFVSFEGAPFICGSYPCLPDTVDVPLMLTMLTDQVAFQISAFTLGFIPPDPPDPVPLPASWVLLASVLGLLRLIAAGGWRRGPRVGNVHPDTVPGAGVLTWL